MPGGTYDLNGKKISATYHRVVQYKSGSEQFLDGRGDTINNFTLSGSQVISGSLDILGTLTANRLVVSQSIIEQSGSTRWGDTLDDTHQFTGSLSISGSLKTPYKYTLIVAKSGGDFDKIQDAIDYAIVKYSLDVENQCLIKIASGKYTEQISPVQYINIVAMNHPNPDDQAKGVILYNTGADSAHWPIASGSIANISGITIETIDNNVFGQLSNSFLKYCYFKGGHFIESAALAYMDFRFCTFVDDGFNLTGSGQNSFIALRHCDMFQGGTPVFGSSTGTIKFQYSMIADSVTISGSWNTICEHTEFYGGGKLTFDTKGNIFMANTLLPAGIHFISNPTGTKVFVGNSFKSDKNYISASTGDITADVDITNVDYVDNNQYNGLSGKIQTIGTERFVGGSKDSYLSIYDALLSISASESRSIVLVKPGIYTENNPLIMKTNVNVISTGEQTATKIVAQNTGSNIVELVRYAALKGFELEGATSASAVYADFDGSTYIQDCTVIDCQNGLEIVNSGSEIGVYNINALTINTTMSNLIKVTAGKADIRNAYVIEDSQIESVLYASGSNSRIHGHGMICLSKNVEKAAYLNDGAEMLLFATHIQNSDYGIYIDTLGSSKISARSTDISASLYDLYSLSAAADINLMSVDMARDRVYSTGEYRAEGYDPLSEKWRRKGNVAIGLDGSGNSLEIGEGGKYRYGVTVLSYNSSSDSYTDVTSGSHIEFANTGSDNAIYIGDTNNNRFYGIGYTLSSSIDLGNGLLVWEYFDSGSDSWLKCNTLNTLEGCSNNFSGYSLTGSVVDNYTIRYDQHIKTGVIESDLSAKGWGTSSVDGNSGRWIRCRISESIDTSPDFAFLYCKGNYTTIRPNGTTAYHGESRGILLHQATFGDSIGSAGNASVIISPNITYPYIENRLASNQVDEMFFRFVLPTETDTSCGITVKAEWTSTTTQSADTSASIDLYAAIIETGYIVSASLITEEHQSHDFMYYGGQTANIIHREEFSRRIDISKICPGNTVYFKIYRNGPGDPLSEHVDLTNIWLEYYRWQNGICIR